jgi:hypothetical protein
MISLHTERKREREKEEKTVRRCSDRHYTLLLWGGVRKVTALKGFKQCPLVLLVEVG